MAESESRTLGKQALALVRHEEAVVLALLAIAAGMKENK